MDTRKGNGVWRQMRLLETSHMRTWTADNGASTALDCDVRTLFIGKINAGERRLVKEARIQKHFEKSDLIFKYIMYGQTYLSL